MSESPEPRAKDAQRGRWATKLARLLGSGVYRLTVRLAVNAVTVVLSVYFLLNSSAVTEMVSNKLSASVRGDLAVKHLRWGPDPGSISLLGPTLRDEHGQLIASAELLRVRFDWLGLLRSAVAGRVAKAITVRQMELQRPKLTLLADADGRLNIIEALRPTKEPAHEGGQQPLKLHMVRIRVSNAEFRYEKPGLSLSLADASLRGSLKYDVTPGQKESMRYEWSRVKARSLVMRGADGAMKQLPQVSLAAKSVHGDGHRVVVNDCELIGQHSSASATTLATRWSGDNAQDLPLVKTTGLTLKTSTDEPLVRALLGPEYRAKASFAGALSWRGDGSMQIESDTDVAGLVAGFQLKHLRGQTSVSFAPKGPNPWRVKVRALLASGYGGRISSDELTYTMTSQGASKIDGVLAIKALALGELLNAKPLAVSPTVSLASQGTLGGEVSLHLFTRALPDASHQTVCEIEGALGWLAAKTDLALPRLQWKGGLHFEQRRDPQGVTTKSSLQLQRWRLSDRLTAKGVPSEANGAQWAKVDGALDLADRTLDVTGAIAVSKLGPWMHMFGVKRLRGDLRLDRVKASGLWMNPELTARVRAKQIDAYGYRLSSSSGELRVRSGEVALRHFHGDVRSGHLQGDLAVKLFNGSLAKLRSPIEVSGQRVSVTNVGLSDLFATDKMGWLKGQLSLRHGYFSMRLDRPWQRATASADVSIHRVTARHERFREVSAHVKFGGGRVRLQKARLQFASKPRARGQARHRTITVDSMEYDLASRQFAVRRLVWPEMRWQDIGEIAALKMPLKGFVGGTVETAVGSRGDLAFEGTLRMRELAWDAIYMGDATLRLKKQRRAPASVTSEAFFERFKLLAGSKLHFKRLTPMWLQSYMRTRKLDPMEFLALPAMGDMRMLATGRAEVRLDFRPGEPVFSVMADLPSGGAELELGNGLAPLANKRPTKLKVLPDRVEVGSLVMTMGREEMELCGTFFYPNATKATPSTIDFFVAGGIDVPRVGGLAESFANLDLRLRIAKDAKVQSMSKTSCLKTVASRRGKLHLSGPLDHILPQGRLRLLSGRMTMRGYGKEIVLTPGSQMSMEQTSSGDIQLTIPADRRLEGQLGEGRFFTSGRLTLSTLGLKDIDWQFSGTDLAHAVPKEYSVVATTQLRFVGQQLLQRSRRKMTLSGKVKVTEGSYSKSFDKLGRVISGVSGRELASYSRPLTETMPWLKEVALDLDVDGSNFLVLSRFPFGKTDLELNLDLKVGGKWGAMRIFDRVEVQPGSLLTYSVVKRDFEVTRGTIDFAGDPMKGVIDLEAKSEVELQTGTSAAANTTMSVGPNLASGGSSALQQKVTVLVRIAGPLDDPSKLDIQLDSVPSYQQGDIQSLILTGQLLTSANPSIAGNFGSRSSINLLTDDLAKAFSEMVLSAFVDKVSVGIPVAGGGITANVQTSLGKYLTLGGDFYSQGSEVRSTGRFTFLLPFEGLYLESLLISTRGANSTQTQNIFEGRVRYRMRLSE